MTVSTGPHRPVSKEPPLTDAEMAAMWRDGEPMSIIAARARRRNGLNKTDVREIVHRVCGLAEMGVGR